MPGRNDNENSLPKYINKLFNAQMAFNTESFNLWHAGEAHRECGEIAWHE